MLASAALERVACVCFFGGDPSPQMPFLLKAARLARQRAARVDPDTPYVLLAFYPCHLMSDLPPTSRRQAEACLQAACHAGLTRVRVGNVHLLQ